MLSGFEIGLGLLAAWLFLWAAATVFAIVGGYIWHKFSSAPSQPPTPSSTPLLDRLRRQELTAEEIAEAVSYHE